MQKIHLFSSNSPLISGFLPEVHSYGFNGKELDSEGMGGGSSTYDYGFRIYNPALGKFLSVDPLFRGFPWNSPYAYAENDVVRCIDLDGLEKYIVHYYYNKVNELTKIRVVAFTDNDGNATENALKTSGVPMDYKDVLVQKHLASGAVETSDRDELEPVEKEIFDQSPGVKNSGTVGFGSPPEVTGNNQSKANFVSNEREFIAGYEKLNEASALTEGEHTVLSESSINGILDPKSLGMGELKKAIDDGKLKEVNMLISDKSMISRLKLNSKTDALGKALGTVVKIIEFKSTKLAGEELHMVGPKAKTEEKP